MAQKETTNSPFISPEAEADLVRIAVAGLMLLEARGLLEEGEHGTAGVVGNRNKVDKPTLDQVLVR